MGRNLPADLLGRRVTARSRTGGIGPTGGPQMTDVVGHVREITESTLVVENRHGEHRTVQIRDLVALKVLDT